MGLPKVQEMKDFENPEPQSKIDETSLTGSMSSDASSDDFKTERGNWKGKMDFLLSLIGYAVGLGNIWRFPYLCYRSGGGAFLIPYLFFMVVCGMPLFFMEIAYGQFASLSPVTIWSISPLFKGVGYGMVIISGIVCIYYNIIIAWTLYYLFVSMQSVLPWSNCDNDWNTEQCALSGSMNSTVSNYSTNGNFSSFMLNSTLMASNVTKIPPSQEFWQRQVLQLTEGIENLGGIRYELLGCLALAWVIVFLCLCKGVQSSGKVVYVTATFPYLVLVILLVRGVTLPGAMDGLRFYLIPDWDKLFTLKVWGDAAVQIFYSMGMAWGGLITMSSYNKFNNNVYRDAIMVPLMNCGTSIFAGLVIFSILGFMAKETGVHISEVATQGPGLAFVAYPAAISRLPISPLWAILFFLMLLTVGLDTQFSFQHMKVE
ncbi:sodium- and chloride-dependent glycine transporter 1 isoform X2 [Patella vulgata]|uniref:sodium- and chloride-dependent glycine transporter 1 isoform X2 n=1 Tax=Patella vulgata TaxID=6465 RepID=UPI0021801BDC|nr:sodium- and chloride-dependent glycine transporter 1 isoform X2 [Patella vulgata]